MIVHAGSCLGAVFSSDLIPSESDQTWMIGLEKFPPKFSQNKPDLIYGDIRCLINILELNLTTSPLSPPPPLFLSIAVEMNASEETKKAYSDGECH